jgi:3-methylcrotonyl-CoA carboxylase alpha subunit
MFKRILIANRGEIACRVIATCRRLGVETVAVYSDADAGGRAVRLADQAWHLGGSRPAESYLRGDRIIEIALASGAEAVHPGFGFLSENADFAESVEAAGLVFIGPRAASMRKMGSKAGAKQLMEAAGVPVVPGYNGEDQDDARLRAEAQRIGTPLMLKAAHGGGGKGMRIVRDLADFDAALASARREANNAFGRDRMLLERYIETPRHIEFQVFGDRHGQIIHLNERECSVQRRYQKIIEESPSPFLDQTLRAQMGAAAVAAARAIDYQGAGTVEFIVGPDRGYWFMEMNVRLQVEHPVTEAVLGVDLVEWQLRVASGEPLPLAQDQLQARGHAIEARLYAEDPEQGFLPGSGRLQRLRLPIDAAGLRVDAGVEEGDEVSVYYDPMIAKIIAHGDDREQARRRLLLALRRSVVVGPKSNLDFLSRLLDHPRFTDGQIDTGYLDRALDEVLGEPRPTTPRALIAATLRALLEEEAQALRGAHGADADSPWQRADGWRLGHPGKRLQRFEVDGKPAIAVVHGSTGAYQIQWPGLPEAAVEGALLQADEVTWRDPAGRHRCSVYPSPGGYQVVDAGRRFHLRHLPAFAQAGSGESQADTLRAPMPGRVVAVRVAIGDEVAHEQELLVMEAMKMELSLKAPTAGLVGELRVEVGQFVEADALLVRIKANAEVPA